MIIKKVITIIVLIFIIAVTFSYIFFKIEAQSLDGNYFNNNLRASFDRYPIVRGILGLHFDGDARADYLGSRYGSIVIKVISMEGLSVDSAILKSLSEKIQKTTGKPTRYLIWETDVPFRASSSIEELQAYLERKDSSSFSGEVPLYLLIANELEDQPDQIGSTVQENGIVLFESSLLKYEHSDNELFGQFAVGVLLHEFGHQLGLVHNDYPRCLMNPSIEFSASNRTSEIVEDFCEEEIKELSKTTF